VCASVARLRRGLAGRTRRVRRAEFAWEREAQTPEICGVGAVVGARSQRAVATLAGSNRFKGLSDGAARRPVDVIAWAHGRPSGEAGPSQ
jgi:DNA-binding IclR family transcriptional regulator